MKRFLRVVSIGSGLAILLFIAFLITFGGAHTVPLSEKITNAQSLVPPTIAQTNLTEVLTSKIAENIVAKNPAGPIEEGTAILAPNVADVINDIIDQHLQDFDVSEIWPVVNPEELIIVRPTTPANRRDYFQSYLETLSERLLENYLRSNPPTPAEFMAVSLAYKETMAKLSALPVPDELVDIQIQTLELVGAQANIFEILSQYETDPIKALLASRLHETIAQEAGEVREKMLSYIRDHPIDF